jgi:hypothetical protein
MELAYRVLYRISAHGADVLKPAKLTLFFTGADTFAARTPHTPIPGSLRPENWILGNRTTWSRKQAPGAVKAPGHCYRHDRGDGTAPEAVNEHEPDQRRPEIAGKCRIFGILDDALSRLQPFKNSNRKDPLRWIVLACGAVRLQPRAHSAEA